MPREGNTQRTALSARSGRSGAFIPPMRLALHLGLRQKDLRQPMVCPRWQLPRSERQAVDMKRDELCLSDRDAGWEMLIPAIAAERIFGS